MAIEGKIRLSDEEKKRLRSAASIMFQGPENWQEFWEEYAQAVEELSDKNLIEPRPMKNNTV